MSQPPKEYQKNHGALCGCEGCELGRVLEVKRKQAESGNQPSHVCGLEGYGAEGDSCPECELRRGNQPQERPRRRNRHAKSK